MTTLKLADGWTLSTEHSASSYGVPVLVGPDGQAYSRHDILVGGDEENLTSAAFIAAEKAAKVGLTQHKMVQAFILGRSATGLQNF